MRLLRLWLCFSVLVLTAVAQDSSDSVDRCFEPALIPTGERSDIGEQKARVEEIGRIADQLRECESIRDFLSTVSAHLPPLVSNGGPPKFGNAASSPKPERVRFRCL